MHRLRCACVARGDELLALRRRESGRERLEAVVEERIDRRAPTRWPAARRAAPASVRFFFPCSNSAGIARAARRGERAACAAASYSFFSSEKMALLASPTYELRIGLLRPQHAVGEVSALELRAEEDPVDGVVLRPPARCRSARTFSSKRAHMRLPLRDRRRRE